MKKFWGKTTNIARTGLKDEIDISYKKLVGTFGEPHFSDGFKTDAEWDLKFPGDMVATIYNYKTGKNYLGDEGLETENIRDWHIGGSSKLAGLWVELALELIKKQQFIMKLFGDMQL